MCLTSVHSLASFVEIDILQLTAIKKFRLEQGAPYEIASLWFRTTACSARSDYWKRDSFPPILRNSIGRYSCLMVVLDVRLLGCLAFFPCIAKHAMASSWVPCSPCELARRGQFKFKRNKPSQQRYSKKKHKVRDNSQPVGQGCRLLWTNWIPL